MLAERAVDPEKASVRREESLPDRECSKAASNCLSVAATRAPRAEYSRERKNATQSTLIACGKAPAYGARTFAKSTRTSDRDSGQDRRRADGDEDRAGPIALPDRAGDEESIDLDRQHEEILDGEGRAGRRADRQQARAAPGQRHRSQLEDGSAQRHP